MRKLRLRTLLFLAVGIIFASSVSWSRAAPESATGPRASPRGSDKACLVIAAWLEARGEGPRVTRLIMHVLKNRTSSSRGACAALLERNQFSDVSHYSYLVREAISGSWGRRPKASGPLETEVLARLEVQAAKVDSGSDEDPTGGATYFYNPQGRVYLGLSRDPKWAHRMSVTARMRGFIFLKGSKVVKKTYYSKDKNHRRRKWR
jgi:hypothetical protein